MFTIHLASNNVLDAEEMTLDQFEELSHGVYQPQPMSEKPLFTFKETVKLGSMYVVDGQGRVWYYQNLNYPLSPGPDCSLSVSFDKNIGRMFRFASKGTGNCWL